MSGNGAVTQDVVSHINEALGSMLGHTNSISLDQRLVAASKKILLQKIEFEPARRTSSLFPLHTLRAKYAPLNASSTSESPFGNGNKAVVASRSDDGIPVPSRILCAPESIRNEWSNVKRVGVGLTNLGNTCFLNATLQCLAYTAPLVNYLAGSNHAKTCKVIGFCMMCELHKHISVCFDPVNRAPMKPLSILQKLRMIAKHMRWGRQEDAHEFLRYVVDALQRANLIGLQQHAIIVPHFIQAIRQIKDNCRLDQRSKETCAVYQIFGGYLRSQVTCLTCRENSNTFDPFLDLCMDVRNVSSVEAALHSFVKPELLAKDNAYICARCKCKVTARKTFAIHRAPNVLTIQLKRYGVHGGKVTRHINYSERLDLRPYMSGVRTADPVWYRLYAVLVHDGSSTNSGHYYCYVNAPGGNWHCMNDSSVYPTSVQRVLQAEAYLLFYVRDVATSAGGKLSTAVSNGVASLNGVTPSTKVTSSGSSVILQRSKSEPCLSINPLAAKQSTTAQVPDPKWRPKNAPTLIIESKVDSKKSQVGLADKAKHGVINGIIQVPAINSLSQNSSIKTDDSIIGLTNGHSSHLSNGSSHRSPEKVAAPNSSSSASVWSCNATKFSVVVDCKTALSNSTATKSASEVGFTRLISESSINGVHNGHANSAVSSPDSGHAAGKVMNGTATSSERSKLVQEKQILNDLGAKKLKADPKGDATQHCNPKSDCKTATMLNATSPTVRATTQWHVTEVSKHFHHKKTSDVVHGTTRWRVTPAEFTPVRSSVSINKSKLSLSVDEPKLCNGKVNCNEAVSPPKTEIVKGGSVQKQLLNDDKTNSVSSVNGYEATSAPSASTKKIKQDIVVQKWDQIVTKGYRTKGVNVDPSIKKIPTWDGSCQQRNYFVTPERASGIFGVGGGVEVSTWDGGPSVLGNGKPIDGKASRKRSSDEDDEIDRGRVKKVKKHKDNEDDSRCDSNRFQQHQNFKNMESDSKKTGIFSIKGR